MHPTNGTQAQENEFEASLSGKILITAHPRSGTHFTAKLLRQMGYSASIEGRWMLPHTRFVSSWKHAQSGAFRNRLYTRDMRQNFVRIIHQVRHPLDVIASARTLTARTVDHIKKYVDIPEQTVNKHQPLVLCMRSWYGWNKLIEERADWRFQLEQLPEVFPEFCHQLGIQPREYLDIGPRNTREHASLDWAELYACEPKLAEQVQEMASRYGYTD